MVFNESMHQDYERIKVLGGAAKVAELLGFDKARGGVQRVHNWRERGIPAAVKVARPDLFMVGLERMPGAGAQLEPANGA